MINSAHQQLSIDIAVGGGSGAAVAALCLTIIIFVSFPTFSIIKLESSFESAVFVGCILLKSAEIPSHIDTCHKYKLFLFVVYRFNSP